MIESGGEKRPYPPVYEGRSWSTHVLFAACVAVTFTRCQSIKGGVEGSTGAIECHIQHNNA